MSRKNASGLDRHLSKLISPNPDINEDRKLGLELIEELGRKPHEATKENLKWFWEDYGLYNYEAREEPELYKNAKGHVERNFDKLNAEFPFELTEWLLNWYSFMPDAFFYKKDKVGQVDWNILFSLIGTDPPTDSSSFYLVTKALNVSQGRLVREAIYKEVAGDPKLRDRVINYKPLPLMYTYYTPYGKIRREVLKRIKPPRQAAPSGSRAIFKAISKMMKEEEVDFNTALKKAEKEVKK